ncbi:MAG: hypothetical protein U9O87_09630 [Verrucomicrobiota bacterium]|nr:hypothetical protein [Verrucomicrobiota bacterium]
MENKKYDIRVMGLGKCGGRIVSAMSESFLDSNFKIAVADTDSNDLKLLNENIERIQLGKDWTEAHTCGGDFILGRKATSASSKILSEFIDGGNLLICILGLSGGAGSGASGILSRLARKAKIPTIFYVTLPFSMEGLRKESFAEEILRDLRAVTDAVIVIPNDILFTCMSPDVSAKEAFKIADKIMSESLFGFLEILNANTDDLFSLDFTSIINLLKKRNAESSLTMIKSEYTTPEDLIDKFLNSPLSGGHENIKEADAIVFCLLFNKNFSIANLKNCLSTLENNFEFSTNISVGTRSVNYLSENTVSLVGLIIHYKDKEQKTKASIDLRIIKGKDKDKDKKTGKKKQGELLLIEQRLGCFTNESPTIGSKGDNLDIPTFQREAISINTGR